MPTYFNYVEREADSYVNWADVGRDMSNTIDDIQRVREEKKGLIEKTYREDLKFIQDNPSGEHETLRAWSLGVAQSSAEMMRLQNTLLKQGKLNLPNYLSFRQNITDSVEKIYTVNGQLQEAFKEVNDRTKEGANQELERQTKVLLEKYGKLEDTEAYINPLNGTIYLGLTEIVEEGGKSVKRLKKGDGTYLSPDDLQAAAMQKFDNFDERPVLKDFAEGLGDVKEQIRLRGGEALAGAIYSVSDVTYDRIIEIANSLPENQRPTTAQLAELQKYAADFKASETKFIEGVLNNKYNASALLTERIKSKDGNPYNIVFNKADQKTEYDIYVEKTPEGKFTPVFDEKTDAGKKQKEVLTDYLRGQLRVMYDRTAEQQAINEPVKQKDPPPPRASAAELEYSGRQQSVAALGSELGKVYNRGLDERQTVLSGLAFYPGVNKGGQLWFSEENNGKDKYLNVIDNNGNEQKFAFEKNGVAVRLEDFAGAVAPALYGNPDLVTEQRTAFMNSLKPYEVYNKDWGTGAEDKKRINKLWGKRAIEEEKVDPFTGIGKNIDKVDIFGSIQATAAIDLKTALGGLGKQLTINKSGTSAYGVGYDRVTVTAPNGEKIVLITGYGNSEDEEKTKQKNRLLEWLRINVKPELE